MIVIECAVETRIPVSHPDVAEYQCAVYDGGVVVAVMLRPVYGRSERTRVLREVAYAVRRYLSLSGGAVSVPYGSADLSCVPVYVLADVDVYQAILHGEILDLPRLATRPGCYVLTD